MEKTEFIPITDVSEDVFEKAYESLVHLTPLELYMSNDEVLFKYNLTILSFLEYIIQIGVHYERFEECRKLTTTKDKYLTWIKINKETALSIFNLVENLKEHNKERKRHED